MAPTGALFGSQHCSENSAEALENNARNTPSKETQFRQLQINFIHNKGIVTRFRRHHFQALPSSTTLPHSTWDHADNKALLQPKDIRELGHRGKHMISATEVIVDLKCSPLCNSQDRSHHLLVCLEFLLHYLETIQ
jgi:hypothetical protein